MTTSRLGGGGRAIKTMPGVQEMKLVGFPMNYTSHECQTVNVTYIAICPSLAYENVLFHRPVDCLQQMKQK